jgi:hypothetical protein
MPDARPTHTTISPAANAIYGPRGPSRAAKGPPQTLEDHVNEAIAQVSGLTPSQRNSVYDAVMAMTRDISFIHLIHDSARGPWSHQAAEGSKGWWE